MKPRENGAFFFQKNWQRLKYRIFKILSPSPMKFSIQLFIACCCLQVALPKAMIIRQLKHLWKKLLIIQLPPIKKKLCLLQIEKFTGRVKLFISRHFLLIQFITIYVQHPQSYMLTVLMKKTA